MYVTVFLICATWLVLMLVTYHQFKPMTNLRLAVIAGIATGIAITFFFSTILLLVLMIY